MKRIGNLFEKVASIENLYQADANARKGKTNTWGVILHDRNKEKNLADLHDALVNKTFRTSKYHNFVIYEPKERIISRLPYYPDRIVHHAVMNVMEPIWVGLFTADTFSCIKDRGIHLAAKKVRRALKEDPEGTRFCLKIDVKKFYPSIDHSVLKGIVRRKIKDPDLLWLIDEIIDSASGPSICVRKNSKGKYVRSVVEGDNKGKGVPIGNYLSQFFANLYLTYFDHWIKEEKGVKYYFRYADDIVVFASDKKYLHDLLVEIRAYLRDNLKLKVKRNFQVFPTDSRGVDFLGFRFYHTHTLIRKRIKKNMCRRVAVLRHVLVKHPISRRSFRKQVASWWGWCKYSDSKNLCKTIFKNLPYEIKFKR